MLAANFAIGLWAGDFNAAAKAKREAQNRLTQVQRNLRAARQRTSPELEEANQDRIVGLTIGLDPLVEIRKARLKQLGMSVDANYGLKDQVKAELDYARTIFAQHAGWPVIDVTGRAIEETAVIILESLKDRDETKQIAKQIV